MALDGAREGTGRLVFFCRLIRVGVIASVKWVKVLQWIALDVPPCYCRLKAIQTMMGNSHGRVYSIWTADRATSSFTRT